MTRIESVLIAGAGAVGLTVAYTIHQYNSSCISILAKEERLMRYRKNGFFVNGAHIDFALTDAATNSAKPFDLIIIASKYHQLSQIIADIKPFVGGNTIILSLLNGISSEDIIGTVYGKERLPLSMIIATDVLREAQSITFTQRGIIHFGDAEGKNGEREQRISEFFTRAGVAHEVQQTMKHMLWFKFMLNVGVNQVSAVLRLPYAAFQNKGGANEVAEARLLAENAMREVIAIANVLGISLGDADIENWYKAVNVLRPDGRTSMCQDVLAGRKTEVEMFSCVVIDLGKKLGILVPINEILFLQLRAIEASYLLNAPQK
jgi:2-dehydropantoate 2-reductase